MTAFLAAVQNLKLNFNWTPICRSSFVFVFFKVFPTNPTHEVFESCTEGCPMTGAFVGLVLMPCFHSISFIFPVLSDQWWNPFSKKSRNSRTHFPFSRTPFSAQRSLEPMHALFSSSTTWAILSSEGLSVFAHIRHLRMWVG